MTSQSTNLTIPPHARCLDCGYSLYQLETDRCPECGKAFDRLNPRSMGIVDPFACRLARYFDRPTSRETRARPWIATAIILLLPLIPAAIYVAIFTVAELWIFFAVRHLSALAARRFLAGRNFLPSYDGSKDTRLLLRGVACFAFSIIWLIVPVYGYIAFALFHADLYRLASKVPLSPVYYSDIDHIFGYPRIGFFKPNAINRFPHRLEISAAWNIHDEEWYDTCFPTDGVVFVLEDDPGYRYDNFWRWHVAGKWYVQYRL